MRQVEYLGIVASENLVFAIAPNAPLDLQGVERRLGKPFAYLSVVNISHIAAGVDARLRELADFSRVFEELGLPEWSGFTLGDVSEILGIPERRLADWADRKLIPVTESAHGSGHHRKFTRDDVVCVAVFSQLLADGLNREFASRVVRALNEITDGD